MNCKLNRTRGIAFILLLPLFLLLSCEKNTEEEGVWKEQWLVGPSLIHITNWAEASGDYLEIKKVGSDTWTVYPNAVEGFDYEEGYEYEILVKGRMTPKPVIDRPSELYSLIKIISKEKKNPDL